jgi:hypothetical protein
VLAPALQCKGHSIGFPKPQVGSSNLPRVTIEVFEINGQIEPAMWPQLHRGRHSRAVRQGGSENTEPTCQDSYRKILCRLAEKRTITSCNTASRKGSSYSRRIYPFRPRASRNGQLSDECDAISASILSKKAERPFRRLRVTIRLLQICPDKVDEIFG